MNLRVKRTTLTRSRRACLSVTPRIAETVIIECLDQVEVAVK